MNSKYRQTWSKKDTRRIKNGNGKWLHCPERNGGYSPTLCKCNYSKENYHEKRKSIPLRYGKSAPARISTNQGIYIGPNNNMNACLKVVKNKRSGELMIHSPCSREPWKTRQKCKPNGHYRELSRNYVDPKGSSRSVHQLDCSEFRLNN